MKPSNVDLQKVEGRYIMGVRDGEDPDSDPDFIAAEGSFLFEASVPYLPDATADPSPVVIFPPHVKGVLDSEGYLCTARIDGTPGERGVWLIVTDDPDLPVTGWTWNVTYTFTMIDGVLPKIDPHSFAVPGGPTPVNLVTVVKTPASPGYGLPQAEAAVLRAEAAATVAEAAALDVVTRADTGEFDGTDGTSGDTLTMGTVTTVAAGGSATATFTGTSPNKVLNLGLPAGVAGNATVRFSTTAGKAIYLTEPGTANEHLIQGDTGWRDISSLLINGWTGAARIRRVGRLVTVTFGALAAATATNAIAINLPAGFKYVNADDVRVLLHNAGTTWRRTFGNTSFMAISISSYVAGDSLFGSFSFVNDEVWPTTLPGTAIGTIPAL